MNKPQASSRYISWILIGLIMCLSVFTKSVNLNQHYTFDWDQSDDATKVMSMIWNKKPLLIGPRVANENSFFVGPFHYYFLTPFYLLTQGHPIAGAYASLFVGAFTVLITYLVAKRIYGEKIALLASAITSASVSVDSWNAMFITPIALIGYYLCLKLLRSNHHFILTAFLASIAATIHLVPALLLIYVAITQVFTSQRATFKQILISCLVFAVSLSPLIVFDIRHDFLNSHKIIEFLIQNNSATFYNPWLFLRTLWRSLFISNSIDILYYQLLEKLLIVSSFIYSIFAIKDKKERLFSLTWILLPVTLLSQYHGNIPEYYYGFVTALIPIFVSNLLSSISPMWLNYGLLLILIVSQISYRLNYKVFITLQDKLNVVQYIANQKDYPTFNVSYDLPLGYNTGYDYLFKYLKKEPVSGPEGHLFSISLTSKENEKFVYTSGILGVIRR